MAEIELITRPTGGDRKGDYLSNSTSNRLKYIVNKNSQSVNIDIGDMPALETCIHVLYGGAEVETNPLSCGYLF